MNITKGKILLLGIAIFLLCSCEFLVDLTTDDSADTIIYKIDHVLTQISLREDMDLELIESEDSVMIIDGPKAILEKLTITNEEGNMEIEYRKAGNWKYEKPHIQLKMPKIIAIRLYKFNNVYANDTLRTDKIDIYSDGTGDVILKVNNKQVSFLGTAFTNFYISGKTDLLSAGVSYASSIKGATLIAQSVGISSYSSNNQIVNPIKILDCSIQQSGNIYYTNEPNELIVNILENAKGRAIFDKNAN